MRITIFENARELGIAAGKAAARIICDAIAEKGEATIIMATGTSQFEVINQLVVEKNIDWGKVIMFHLDEYIGLPVFHPASFRKYLQERFLSKVPPLKNSFLINGETDPKAECARIGALINKHPVDVALVGIGENGHLAFNDPPADIETEQPFIIVQLDEACRKQQLGEGWFGSLEEVPPLAISMSIKQILKAKHIICSAPDHRKAVAVRNAVENPVNKFCPASMLQLHPDCVFYLDRSSAGLLSPGIMHG